MRKMVASLSIFFIFVVGLIGGYLASVSAELLDTGIKFSCEFLDEGQKQGAWSVEQRGRIVDQIWSKAQEGREKKEASNRFGSFLKGADGGCDEQPACRDDAQRRQPHDGVPPGASAARRTS